MDFKEIPLFPKSGYQVDIFWFDLLRWVDQQVKDEALDLSPEFQRGHVWTEEQRILYVEYILRGGEGGRDLCFNRYGWSGRVGADGPYEILDGLQRLTSAMMFMRGELPAFRLQVAHLRTAHARRCTAVLPRHERRRHAAQRIGDRARA